MYLLHWGLKYTEVQSQQHWHKVQLPATRYEQIGMSTISPFLLAQNCQASSHVGLKVAINIFLESFCWCSNSWSDNLHLPLWPASSCAWNLLGNNYVNIHPFPFLSPSTQIFCDKGCFHLFASSGALSCCTDQFLRLPLFSSKHNISFSESWWIIWIPSSPGFFLLDHHVPPLQHDPHHPLHSVRVQDAQDTRELQRGEVRALFTNSAVFEHCPKKREGGVRGSNPC